MSPIYANMLAGYSTNLLEKETLEKALANIYKWHIGLALPVRG